MSSIPARVAKRLQTSTKHYLKVLGTAKSMDINESDTVKIIYDMLHDVFGYEKYSDITSEVAIRGTYCDLAIKYGNQVRYLIECKAIGSELKDAHLRQVIDYAAKDGIDWAILTNGVVWQVYKVEFSKPIDKTHLYSVDFLTESSKDKQFLQKLFLLSKEAIRSSAIETFHEERKATDKYTVSAILHSEQVLALIRKIIRSRHKGVTVDRELIAHLLSQEIIKREIIESEQFREATRNYRKPVSRKSKQGEQSVSVSTDSDGSKKGLSGAASKESLDPESGCQ